MEQTQLDVVAPTQSSPESVEKSGTQGGPHSLERDWARVAIEILGLPLWWTSQAQLRYTDPQLYPLRLAVKSTRQRHRADTVLTKNGLRFKKLKVHAAEYLRNEPNSTWQRHSIKQVSTVTMKISQLPLLSKARFESNFGDATWVPWAAWSWYFLTWHIAFAAIWVWFSWRFLEHWWRICFPGRPKVPQLGYLPFYYEDDRYPRVASNCTDNRKHSQRLPYDQPISGDRSASYGLIRPRILLKLNGDAPPTSVRDFPLNARYAFAAFSFSHFPLDNKAQLTELTRVANKAARMAGCEYLWIASSCMVLDAEESRLSEEEQRRIEEHDTYGLSDIVRGATHVTIVLPNPGKTRCPPMGKMAMSSDAIDPKDQAAQAVLPRLQEWGARIWTLPEVLLGPDQPLTICWRDQAVVQWYHLHKRHFPGYVWKDEENTRQVVDHYNNTHLSQLEFVKIVMRCLTSRQQSGIVWHYPGDLSYVLMGLLRIRPPINKHDSSLQAFARLSLPADNNRLMERFVCLSWKSRHDDWHSMEDAFKADLWSIQPYIQISGVGENDTIIVEKAWGARIELAKFTDMSAINIGYLRRLQGVSAGLTVVPPLAEWMAKRFRKGKYKRVFPRLYCFEGFMSLGEIEDKLFGARIDFLSWSRNSSVFSRHEPGKPVFEPKTELSGDRGKIFRGLHSPPTDDVDIEAQSETELIRNAHLSRDSIEEVDGRIKTYPIVGRQPWTTCSCREPQCICPEVTDRRLQDMGRSGMGEDKVFTLIDTATMTVTLLAAAWPPQALIVCGAEGGMERVLACSYDWTTGVLYKECVLRLPGVVLESMHRLPGIRLGFRRTLESAQIARR